MAVKILLNPIIAFIFFMAGMLLGTINILFGLLSIVGGLLFGFSSLHNVVETMNKKTKLLLYGTFFSYLLLFSITYLIIIKILF